MTIDESMDEFTSDKDIVKTGRRFVQDLFDIDEVMIVQRQLKQKEDIK